MPACRQIGPVKEFPAGTWQWQVSPPEPNIRVKAWPDTEPKGSLSDRGLTTEEPVTADVASSCTTVENNVERHPFFPEEKCDRSRNSATL